MKKSVCMLTKRERERKREREKQRQRLINSAIEENYRKVICTLLTEHGVIHQFIDILLEIVPS